MILLYVTIGNYCGSYLLGVLTVKENMNSNQTPTGAGIATKIGSTGSHLRLLLLHC